MCEALYACTLGKCLHVQYERVYLCSCVFVPVQSVHDDSYANGDICYSMFTCVNMHTHIHICVQVSVPKCSCVCVAVCVAGIPSCWGALQTRGSLDFWQGFLATHPESAHLLRAS